MKDEDPPAVAGKLTIVRPFRARKPASDRPVVFDIAALCCASQAEFPLGHEAQSRDHWLRDQLPRTFPDARILAYGHVQQPTFDSDPDFADDPETLAVEFLSLLRRFRRSTNTFDRPLVILFHNSGGFNMLLGTILSVLSILDTRRSPIELGRNTKGIICLEGSRNDSLIPHTSGFENLHLSSTHAVDIDNGSYGLDCGSGCAIPVTVFLDENNTYGQLISASINQYSGRLSVIHARLNRQSYPSTSASATRVVGEVRKMLTSSIPAYPQGVETAHVLRWLSPATNLFRHNSQPAVKGTCKWVFNHESFRSWLSPDQNSVLWITGIPGSGKTVLASFLVDSIREDAIQLQSPAIVSSLFFNFRHSLQRDRGSAKGTLLRALLYQLLEHDPSILSVVSRSCTPILRIPERPEDLDHNYYQRCLRRALSAATNTSTVFIVIDALDECDIDIQDDLLACIEPIFNAPQSVKKIRIAITSRGVPPTKHEFRAERICLEMENSRDISTFCSVILSSKLLEPEITAKKNFSTTRKAEHDSLQQLVDLITERAQGMFLWVHLVTKLLLNDFPAQQYPHYIMKEWQSTVQSLPTELHLLYEELMERTAAEHRPLARLLFTWCSYTVRPLEENELCTALRHTVGGFDELILHDGTFSDWTFALCHGLVEVRPDPLSHVRIVQFVHASVRDYLTGIGARHLPPDAVAHTLIARSCISYLDQFSFSSKGIKDYFFHYSIFNWGVHAEAGDRLGISQDYLIDVFQSPSTDRVSLWLDAYDRFRDSRAPVPKRTSLLHVACHYGILSTTVALLSQSAINAPWDLKDDTGFTPLHHAVTSGHVTVAAKLLEYGSMVDCLDSEKRTPLHVAVRSGHQGFTQLLFETGADVVDPERITVIQCATVDGRVEIARLLLGKGADVNSADLKGKTPLHYAVQHGNVALVRLLIDAGADMSAWTPDGDSILALAAASGNEIVAKFALENEKLSGHLGWPERSFRLALAFAAALGLKFLVHSLLFSGRFAGPNDPYIQQALIVAIASTSEPIVLIFLKFGCSPDVYDHQHGQSALSIAVASGNEPIVRLLLQYGANPNMPDTQSRNTPMMHAINRGSPNIVNLLLQYNAQIELPKRTQMLTSNSWIFRIILALMNECPNGNHGSGKAQGSGASSTESVTGTPDQSGSVAPPSSQSRKRDRRKQVPGGDGYDSEDDPGLRKRSRNANKTEPQFACPYQKRYPERHKCPPKKSVARLKEHIHRNHVGQFCTDCWEPFNDPASVKAHLRTDSCVQQKRVDYSGGICPEQVKLLKLKKGVCKMTDEEHWAHVYRIVFPDHGDAIPSSYYAASDTVEEAIQKVLNDPCLRQRLTQIIGPEQIKPVCDLIRDFGGNQRVGHTDRNTLQVSQNSVAQNEDRTSIDMLSHSGIIGQYPSVVTHQVLSPYPSIQMSNPYAVVP